MSVQGPAPMSRRKKGDPDGQPSGQPQARGLPCLLPPRPPHHPILAVGHTQAPVPFPPPAGVQLGQVIEPKTRANPLQCSCLENPRDRGAWWAAVHGVTRLTRLSSSSSFLTSKVGLFPHL